MPSPDNALPSDGTAKTNGQFSPATSNPEASPATEPGDQPSMVNAPPAEAAPHEASRDLDSLGAPAGDTPVDQGEASSSASAPPTDPSGEATEGGASPTAPRKRRRRRRKKGAHGQGTGASVGASEEGATTETEPAEANAEGGPEAPPGTGIEGESPHVDRSERKGKPRNKTGDKPRERREPRERPVFGVGDVVFGKILEITSDALIIDLSGKAKGIFDLAEMLLPDDTPDAEAPEAPTGDEERVGEEDSSLAHDGSGDAEPALLAASSDESKIDSEVPSPDGDALPGIEGAAERKHAGRRIIVAAGARTVDGEGESPPQVAAPDSPVVPPAERDGEPPSPEAGVLGTQAPDTQGHEGPVGADLAPGDSVAQAASTVAEDVVAENDASTKPAPYAPRIVLEVGAPFVALVHNDGARGGLIVLTHHPRRASKAKGIVSAAFRENKTVGALVTGLVKGGVEVDVDGLRAFVPGSHMELRLGTDLSRFIGQRLEFSVTQYGKRGRDVVLSRKPQLEAEAKASRAAALATLTVGSVVDGLVKSVVAFGAFLDVGGVEGLVSLTEMSHSRSDSPSDVFTVGDTTKVKILRIDDKGKVWLSRRAAVVDPRLDAFKKYAVGTRHAGKVVRLQPFGVFVELEPGIDGLIHTLDLSMKRIEHPSEVVKVGDALDVVVSQLDLANQKIALHPAPTGAASDEPSQRIVLHKPLKVVVVGVETGGLVVRVKGATGRAARGFITAASTGTPRGTELRKPFPVGTELEAKVVEYDPKRGDLKLSIKALREDSERNAYQQYRQQVHREAKFGTFGDLLAKKGLTTK